jgi:peptide/nickel transport system permease protein
MTRYILRRTIQMLVLLLLISVLVFGLLQLVPGGPFDQLLASPRVSALDIERLNRFIGLDRPLHERYLTWVTRAMRFDWGESWQVATGQPVSQILAERLPNTLLLMGVSTLLSIAIAIPVGIYSALRRYSWQDYLVTGVSFFGISMPVFWFGLMLMIIFGVELGWLPTSGVSTPGLEHDLVDRLRHLVLPMIVLGLVNVASWSRFMRSSMLEVLALDYLRTARAKGLKDWLVVARHAVPNALIPVITILGLDIPVLFSGAVITETIFAWPGMGRLYIQSINVSDWPVAQAIIMITAFLVILGNLVADILYAVVDPRIRYS